MSAGTPSGDDHDIVGFPDNPISLEDREKLESYGGHEIKHGRATRFRWDEDSNGNPVFDIYRGGPQERLVCRIGRHREDHEFYAENADGRDIVSGRLDHVMAVLDEKLAREHGEAPPTA